MKPGRSITGKILWSAGLNALVLVVSLTLLVQSQLDYGVDSILLSQTHSRLLELVREVQDRMVQTPRSEWDRLLVDAGGPRSLELSVYINDGQYVAGGKRTLPPDVWTELTAEMRDPLGRGIEGHPPPDVQELPRFSQLAPPAPMGRLEKGKGPPLRRLAIFMKESGGRYWFGARMPVALDAAKLPAHGTLMVSSDFLFLNPALFDARPWATGLLIIAALTILCWMPIIGYLTRSLHSLQLGARGIAGGNFATRVNAGHPNDDIGHLSASLNRMAMQLDTFVSGQKRFLGDVAHELSAPIARTQAAIAILEQRAPEPVQGYVERLDLEIQRMSELVRELLQFSEAGLEGPAAAAPVVERVGDVVARVLEAEGAAPSSVLWESGCDLEISAPPNRVFRALSNVVRNALHYAGADGPVLVSAERLASEGAAPVRVAIHIIDSGPGVPEAYLDRIFTPFFRIDSSRSRSSGGSGLGLAITRSSVESSGGSVACRNRHPRGLEVTITLPGVG